MYEIDSYFERYVRGEMYNSIENLLTKETRISCALLLATYTEIIGGLITGNLLKNGHSKLNFNQFFKKMDKLYQQVNDQVNLHKRMRSGLVHEFAPKKQFIVWLSEKEQSTRCGVEYYEESDVLNIHLREYYRDWKNVVESYYKELIEMKNIELIQKFLNSMKSYEDYISKKPDTK